MTLPNFFIIGFPKSGTTALAHYLTTHPGIFFCDPKEPGYFATNLLTCTGATLSKELYPSPESYRRLFDAVGPEHQAVGEGSTCYVWSGEAIDNIMREVPGARIIIMVRNPVDLVYALHGEELALLTEDEVDFDRAYGLQQARREGSSLPRTCRVPELLQYRHRSLVGTHVERVMRLVPPQQRKVIVFDDFVQDTERVYREVLAFLELPFDGRRDFPRVNEARMIARPAIARFFGALTCLPPGLRPIESALRKSARRLGLRDLRAKLLSRVAVKRPRTPMSPRTRQALTESFRSEVSLLSDLLGRRLDHWMAEPPTTAGEVSHARTLA